MLYIWIILAGICLAYYIKCVIYAGRGSSFIRIWIIGALFFAAIFVIRFLEVKNGLFIMSWLKNLFIIALSIGLLVFIAIESLIIVHMKKNPHCICEYIIVLGCQIRGDKITKSLKNRLDTALEYTAANQNVKIIVSGGQGEDENLSEAQAMYNYLCENGISGDRISMEDKSVNTEENLRFSMKFIDDYNSKVGIVTSNFHIFRSTMLAKAKGLSNVCGIASPSDNILLYNYLVRESIGVVKDALVGNFFR